jgi:hypothetical protein
LNALAVNESSKNGGPDCPMARNLIRTAFVVAIAIGLMPTAGQAQRELAKKFVDHVGEEIARLVVECALSIRDCSTPPAPDAVAEFHRLSPSDREIIIKAFGPPTTGVPTIAPDRVLTAPPAKAQ